MKNAFLYISMLSISISCDVNTNGIDYEKGKAVWYSCADDIKAIRIKSSKEDPVRIDRAETEYRHRIEQFNTSFSSGKLFSRNEFNRMIEKWRQDIDNEIQNCGQKDADNISDLHAIRAKLGLAIDRFNKTSHIAE